MWKETAYLKCFLFFLQRLAEVWGMIRTNSKAFWDYSFICVSFLFSFSDSSAEKKNRHTVSWKPAAANVPVSSCPLHERGCFYEVFPLLFFWTEIAKNSATYWNAAGVSAGASQHNKLEAPASLLTCFLRLQRIFDAMHAFSFSCFRRTERSAFMFSCYYRCTFFFLFFPLSLTTH